MKRKYIVISIFLLCLLALVVVVSYQVGDSSDIRSGLIETDDDWYVYGSGDGSHISQANLVYNASDLREVAGFFSDVFVARVIEQKETYVAHKIEGVNLELLRTPYEVEILYVLKGEVEKDAMIVMDGGGRIIRENINKTTEENEKEESEQRDPTKLAWQLPELGVNVEDGSVPTLDVGSVYIFSAKFNKEDGRYYVGSTRSSSIPLDVGLSIKIDTAKAVLESQPDFKKMERAVKEQILSRHNINN